MRNHFGTWDVMVVIPLYELAEHLADTEYDQMEGLLNKDIEITLSFDFIPANKETGIMWDSMDFNGTWDYTDKTMAHPKLSEAIQEYIDTHDITELYGDKSYEKMADYYDYMKYGERL